LIKEPKERGKAPAMIVFCAWQQIPLVQEYGRKHGFMNSYPLYFIKDFSAQVLKANMRIVGGVETALVLYRDKLPKFNNHGQMILNHMPWPRESKTVPKIHPTQKPIALLKRLIEIFTDAGDVVIDPCAGSGTTLRAAAEMGRTAYGFEVDKKFYKLAQEKMLNTMETPLFAEV
jgi:site-specific DNA-methyltransferase (adenine-specific)